ncbi:MAG: hypothetical protein COZ96_04060 [Nitrospirae bacterium CG_4_8_14_3_um_filter_70_85]|nr:MAG: hypothetical protein COZ96_04060 [Nitrospirae bacterium CG_4_8_14_3_um_filter_70_85]PIX84289.1 MAG: hypothetical protein COZ33_01045 [Nitrospirae bacterium CG_4_10_14_3_um_filter_70_108]
MRHALLACALTLTAPLVAEAGGVPAANGFNPALSAILMGNDWGYTRSSTTYALPGFQLGGESGLAAEGLSLAESELTLSANVDPTFYGQLTLAVATADEGSEVEIEEAYGETLALPGGLGVRFGRFFSALGYLNEVHAHAWDFADAPLAYRAFLGQQLFDDGVQVRWVVPADGFVEVGGELLRGRAFPGGSDGSTPGTGDLFLHLGGDVGVSQSWRLGLAHLRANVEARESTVGPPSLFAGDSNLSVVDLVWKWAPHGDPSLRNLLFQAAYFRRAEDGTVAVNPVTGAYDGTQQGGYLQAVYQFWPRLRAGLRYDHLRADDPDGDPAVLTAAGLDPGGHDPARVTVMTDFSPSEFSRLRLQYAADRSRPEPDHSWVVQYILSLGAHGAHAF